MPFARLKAARVAAGYRSARSAAEGLGVPVATYVQHENGTRGMSVQKYDAYLEFFARKGAAS